MKVVIGGTFAHLHKGHRSLITKAFDIGDYVYIGLTTDNFVQKYKPVKIEPYVKRKAALVEFLKRFTKPYEIKPLNDRFGPAVSENFDAIVVTRETHPTALEINKIRINSGLPPLKIVVINYIMGEDLLPITSHRIFKGVIDTEGRRITPIKINVGSINPVKITAVKEVFSQIFANISITSKNITSGISSQPAGAETIKGAYARAKQSIADADYGIGIEAGVFWNNDIHQYFDVHYIAIIDQFGYVTYGHSSGFVYPSFLTRLINQGYSVEQAIELRMNIKHIGAGMGAIGLFSNRKVLRKELITQALMMAMVPRLGWKYYQH